MDDSQKTEFKDDGYEASLTSGTLSINVLGDNPNPILLRNVNYQLIKL